MSLDLYKWLDIEALRANIAEQIIAKDFADEIGIHIEEYYGSIWENGLLKAHPNRNILNNMELSLEVDNLPGTCFTPERSTLARILVEQGTLEDSKPYESASIRYLFSYKINEDEFIPRLFTNILIIPDSDKIKVIREDYIPGWFGFKSKPISLPDDVNPTIWYLRENVRGKILIK